ncbi:MAG: cell division protein ZapA [Clostridia bacterium]|nr:cell division protein ZapA [Clostridia bacterium]
MAKSKVQINVAGMNFSLVTEDDPAYIEGLAKQLSKKIEDIVAGNTNISVAQAAVLVALDCEDELSKHNNSSDNLRAQIKDYLEDAARARMEAEGYKRELEKLKAELQ